MALELKIPTVGESVTEVTISQWLKEDGDYVEMDEPVAELESDKATVELNAEAAGALKIIITGRRGRGSWCRNSGNRHQCRGTREAGRRTEERSGSGGRKVIERQGSAVTTYW